MSSVPWFWMRYRDAAGHGESCRSDGGVSRISFMKSGPDVPNRAVVDDHDALAAHGLMGFWRDQEFKISTADFPSVVDFARRTVSQAQVHGPLAEAGWLTAEGSDSTSSRRQGEAVEEGVIDYRQAPLQR